MAQRSAKLGWAGLGIGLGFSRRLGWEWSGLELGWGFLAGWAGSGAAWNWAGISSHAFNFSFETKMKIEFEAKLTQFLFMLFLRVSGLGFLGFGLICGVGLRKGVLQFKLWRI